MTTPRLEIDLDKIHHNAHTLVNLLAGRGISVTAVTKATLGSPEIAGAMRRAGVSGFGDSRIENIGALHRGRIQAPLTLIRSPMLSQVDRVVRQADVSFNTELDIIGALSDAAQEIGRTHGIVLMVELGDLREGIMPDDLEATARAALRLPNIALRGIGANLACRSGVCPDARNMAELSMLANSLEANLGAVLGMISGGNSGSLAWALSGADTGRVNNLRLGESLLLGREPLHRQAIDGLHTDAITLIAEVMQTILAVGHQDTDPFGLVADHGIEILGASSDHLIVDAGRHNFPVGSEISFKLNYSALLQAMTSPFVAKSLKHEMAAFTGSEHDNALDIGDVRAQRPHAIARCSSDQRREEV
jgi:predicted amino acid racemase